MRARTHTSNKNISVSVYIFEPPPQISCYGWKTYVQQELAWYLKRLFVHYIQHVSKFQAKKKKKI